MSTATAPAQSAPQAAPATPSTTQSVTMYRGKECKGSVRYEVPKPLVESSVVTNVYLARAFKQVMPDSITVTIVG